jgi:glycosyltransferase involved in cell wall biosynthesis
MKNILYIATPASVHDRNWMKSVSQDSKFRVFLVFEKSQLVKDENLLELCNMGVIVLKPIASFSLLRFWSSIRAILYLRKIVDKNNIHLVHALFATPNSLWLPFLNTSYAITTRGSDVNNVIPGLIYNNSNSFRRRIHDWVLFRIISQAFRKSIFITSTSNNQIEKIQKLFNVKEPKLIRTGIDLEKIKSTVSYQTNIMKEVKQVVVSPRFFQPVYDIKLQLDALALLNPQTLKNIQFVFIEGLNPDTEYASEIRNILSQLEKKVGLNYIVHDFLEETQFYNLLARSKIAIMTPIADGTPNSALEAMALGCPLIISDLPYDYDLFNTDTCIMISERSADNLAALIEESLKNYPEQLRENAIKAVAKYGNRAFEMQKLIKLYHQFL